MWQVDDAAIHRRPGATGCGRRIGGRQRVVRGGRRCAEAGERAREQTRTRHGLPVVRDLAAHDRVRERRLPAAGATAPPASRQAGDHRTRGTRARDDGAAAVRRPARDQALRWAAAAAGAGASDRDRAVAAAAGRAAVQPGRQAARVAAVRAQASAARTGNHLDLRDARPDRGAVAVVEHRRHARRRGRAAGQAAGHLRESAEQVRRGVHRDVQLHRRHRRVARR